MTYTQEQEAAFQECENSAAEEVNANINDPEYLYRQELARLRALINIQDLEKRKTVSAQQMRGSVFSG